ncbi:sigma-70 family RNA polymerase sigma factor [Opitutales bacterium ASA1]|uniref:RNA polymerase sigma factor n=1 Tax=Congregicoccus parvus TaxID=3081749 RepID=UPI002B2BEF7A|nr:sigma-70 family RNA polymerase sigma factor [Opitutales bacterium ASA1]
MDALVLLSGLFGALGLSRVPFSACAATDSHIEPAAEGGTVDRDEDHLCMARLAAGETSALRLIFDRWKLPLLSYFYRALASRADAEDLALQTFERVYRAASRYRPEARFSTWLFSVARRELLRELRRRRRKPVDPVAPEDLEGVDGRGSSACPGEVAELEEALLVALQSLPERQRSVLLLTASGDHSRSEIAEMLSISVGNLDVVLHRARQALRAVFRKET